jgi:hypothetical protein
MKGDFSRIRFNPKKQYTAVLGQQGRLSVDADGNEQCAIDGYLRGTETVDVVGEYGGPIHDAGFAISVEQTEILIGAGRYYVEGLMCENRQNNLPYDSQPYLIYPSPVDSTLISELAQQGGAIQVFLQVWQRLVTALDDPCLHEPALGQADTTARVQTVWRVVADLIQSSSPAGSQPAGATSSQPAPPSGLSIAKAVAGGAAVKKAVKVSALSAKTNLNQEIASVGNKVSGIAGLNINASAGVAGSAPSPAPDCCTQMYSGTVTNSTGTMAAMTGQGSSDCSCQPIPAAGYTGLENQLYRVEIHQPGDQTGATLKWSRENGSVVVAIQSVNGAKVMVDSLGPDVNLGFQPNEWVEISDDSYLFGQTPNQPGLFYQILSVDPTGPSITMTTPVVPVDATLNGRVRRWDQSGSAAASTGIPLPVGTWLTLENGIQISFRPGTYQSGDFWTIPARTATGTIDWPPCGSDGNTFQPPHSIVVYNAPLACIHWDATKGQPVVESCRRIFSPLTELTPPATPPAIHITKYSWQNDDVITFDQLLKSGLTLTLDQAPTGPISGANFIVTVECFGTNLAAFSNEQISAAPAPGGAASSSIYTPVFQTLPLSSFILDWQATVNASAMQITWQLPKTDLTGVQFRFVEIVNNTLLGALAGVGILPRARVKLLGDAIFAQSGATLTYLDGQSFGIPAMRQDKKTPCIALQMPSGNGEKASDFEGWFYLAPFNAVSGLGMNYAALTVVVDVFGGVTGVEAGNPLAPVTAQLTVQLSYPSATIAGTTVSLAISATTTGINTSSYVSLASPTVVVPQGASQATVNVNVFGNPGAGNTYSFQITASVELAYETSEPQTVTFTVTGVQPIRLAPKKGDVNP